MQCPNCGAEVEAGQWFCKDCGSRLSPVQNNVESLDTIGQEATQDSGLEHVIDASAEAGSPSETDLHKQEKEARKLAKQNLKEAKAAYKQARRAAGKSPMSKVIAIIILGLTCAIGGSAAMWYYMDGKHQAEIVALQERSVELTAQAAERAEKEKQEAVEEAAKNAAAEQRAKDEQAAAEKEAKAKKEAEDARNKREEQDNSSQESVEYGDEITRDQDESPTEQTSERNSTVQEADISGSASSGDHASSSSGGTSSERSNYVNVRQVDS